MLKGLSFDRRLRGASAALGLVAVAVWFAGCARSAAYRQPELFRTAIFAPLPPTFLAGPVSVALTNAEGFSARVHAEGAVPGDPAPLSGQLFGRGAKLLFAPDPKSEDDNKKRGVDPGFSFLWDVAQNRGWLLSEALQACAPVSAGLRYTAVKVASAAEPPQELSATLAGGQSYSARIWPGPGGVPSRISAGTNQTAMNVTLSRVRLQVPPVELFVVPQAFTKYASPEALVDELAARQRGFERREEQPGNIPLLPQQ